MAKQQVRIKCPYCNRVFFDVDSYVIHLESDHEDIIPPDMTGWQFYYYLKTGKTHGTCVICKKDTGWNEVTHKYHRFCKNPACKEKYRMEFRERMIGKYGKVSLLDDPEQQRKMLSHRKISGEYIWSNPMYKTEYIGSYEKEFLEFLDHVMMFSGADVMSPSPHTYYYIYEGKKHFYIPDFFIPSLNLEIEIKDGGTNPNTHPKIMEVDKVKERLKDSVMKSNANTFNYIKISDKNWMMFLSYLTVAKIKFENGETNKIFMV